MRTNRRNRTNFYSILVNYGFLTLLRPMEFSIKLHTIKSGWSIVYIEGSYVIISKQNIVFLSLEIDFCPHK